MNIKAVIDAGYGDAGKGRMTDHLSDNRTIVIRFNGGAQAGHTVVMPDGRRHIFHHFGSGSFRQASTYLSKFFIVNPLLYRKEHNELSEINTHPIVYVNPYCYVTTPWDMMVNMMLEKKRGDQRHGSCGYGINETIERTNNHFPLNVNELKSKSLKNLLLHIQKDYTSKRIEELEISPTEKEMSWLTSSNIFDLYMKDIDFFLNGVLIAEPRFKGSQIIFEGAQGIMLDQNHENFPHVTRSNTGVQNVFSLMHDFGMNGVVPEIIYVTRCYATRHGAGPFPHEIAGDLFEDETNTPNEFQGKLRFGLIDVVALKLEVESDLEKFKGAYHLSAAVTCLDQFNPINCIVDRCNRYVTHEEFCLMLLSGRFTKCYSSYGPSGNNTINAKWR